MARVVWHCPVDVGYVTPWTWAAHSRNACAVPEVLLRTLLLPSVGLDKHGIRRWFAWSRSWASFGSRTFRPPPFNIPSW